jgi:hypothetical protein
MDAYFTDKFAELIVPVIKNKGAGKSLVQLLEKAGFDTRQALELLSVDRPYRRIRTLITKFLERTVTQRLDAIDELFLCLGIENFCASVAGRLGRRNLLRHIQVLVERRHKIVHDGDYNRHYRLRQIDPNAIMTYYGSLLAFVRGAEDFLNKAIR